MSFKIPTIPTYSNYTGELYKSEEEVYDNLTEHFDHTVLLMQSFQNVSQQYTQFDILDIGSAGYMSKIALENLGETKVFSIDS